MDGEKEEDEEEEEVKEEEKRSVVADLKRTKRRGRFAVVQSF